MALVSSYDGFIFDYGGVLVHHQTAADQAHMAKVAGIPAEHFSELYWTDRLDYDKGHLTGAEYWYAIGKAGGRTLTPGVIERLIDLDNETWMRFDQVMWDWVGQLHSAGKRVAMLSNMPGDLGSTLKAKTDRLNIFDHVTLSFELHAVKPEPAIYEECLEGLGTPLDRTIFFDDRIENVQGAEMLGLHAIQFLNRDDVLLRMSA